MLGKFEVAGAGQESQGVYEKEVIVAPGIDYLIFDKDGITSYLRKEDIMKKRLLFGTVLGLVVAVMLTAGAGYAQDGDLEVTVMCPDTVMAGDNLTVDVRVKNVGHVPVRFNRAATGLGGNLSDSLMNLGVYGPFVRDLPPRVLHPGQRFLIEDLLIGTVPFELSGKFAGVFVSIIDMKDGEWYTGGCPVAVQ